MRATFVLRVRLIAAAVLIIAAVLCYRLYSVQVVRGEVFAELADRQYVRPSHSLFDRGTIYFTDKHGMEIAGASIKSGYLVAIIPEKISDPEALYDTLRVILPLEHDAFITKAGRSDDPYEEVAHHITPEQADAIALATNPEQVQVFRERWRYYPGNELAAQTLGFVGFGESGTSLSGQYGLERYYNDVLLRRERTLHVNFFAEMFSNVGESLQPAHNRTTGDVVTSIEPTVQQRLESVLAATKDEWQTKEMGGIIMDPRSGQIYALATLPSYNPNELSEVENPRVFANSLVSDVYEMGSIVKPIGMAIGIDAGAVTPSTTYYDGGSVEVDGYTIRNYDGRGRGTVSMQEVLNQSLNTGMVYVAGQVGNREFGDRLLAFGVGEETGIDLPNEVRGLIDNLSSPREVEYATAAFGQGIALTPIATTRALSVLANGGVAVTPHVVTAFKDKHGTERPVTFDPDGRVVSEETARNITEMLVEVVDTALRGGTVAKEHYAIAAKTGTAQIAKKHERGYYDDRYLHSFFGYFPAYDPQFIIFLYHVEPQGARYASETLTTPFMDLVDFLLNYYEVPPDR